MEEQSVTSQTAGFLYRLLLLWTGRESPFQSRMEPVFMCHQILHSGRAPGSQSLCPPGMSTYLVVEHHCPVHLLRVLFIIPCCFHHVLWQAEKSQVHQLVIQVVVLCPKPRCTFREDLNSGCSPEPFHPQRPMLKSQA